MTTRYVGQDGSDSNDGLSWANRKLTLNGVEDTPVVAGDIIYVGPGTYRETLTLDVSGSSGNPITYIGDITGMNTDLIGGEVAISGSDDDVSIVRNQCVTWGANANYRTFRGFHTIRTVNAFYCVISSYAMTNLIIEDCILNGQTALTIPLNSSGNIPTGLIIRRSVISPISMRSSVDRDTVDALIENCIIRYETSPEIRQIDLRGYYNITFNNCTFGSYADLGTSTYSQMVSTANKSYLYNCVFEHMRLFSPTPGSPLIEDYNSHAEGGGHDYRTNIDVGANTNKISNLFELPYILPNGIIVPHDRYTFSNESGVPYLACDSNSSDEDIFGITRPTTLAKRTRGAIQYNILEKETSIVYGTSPESFSMRDAMAVQFIIPITGNRMKISARVYRETDYAGTLPQLTIKQYGEADIVLTDTGSSENWNEFEHSFDPANFPLFIAIEIRSNNTATAGSYRVFWDELEAY